jgi:MoxR-like ATPase
VTPFYEKYAPQVIEDLVLPKSVRVIFSQYLYGETSTPLLLTGKPGTGKSLFATKILPNYTGAFRVLHCNDFPNDGDWRDGGAAWEAMIQGRSLFDEDDSQPVEKVFKRVVVLEEIDQIRVKDSAILKGVIDSFIKFPGTLLVLTSNHPDKIDDAVKSRCQRVRFHPEDLRFSKEKVKEDWYRQLKVFIAKILDKELVNQPDWKENEEVVDFLRDLIRDPGSYPSVRNVLTELEGFIYQGRLAID